MDLSAYGKPFSPYFPDFTPSKSLQIMPDLTGRNRTLFQEYYLEDCSPSSPALAMQLSMPVAHFINVPFRPEIVIVIAAIVLSLLRFSKARKHLKN
ncbi:hypothetical protein HQ45_02320 [Porphyromonas crevioricanis]|nr:hypothetical protein HQ45_02320 [Porphyromonas crevioricanis]SJZ54616.1 hypothetical protein SAMN02745203_00103 [Porphyromonas crevioricanis]